MKYIDIAKKVITFIMSFFKKDVREDAKKAIDKAESDSDTSTINDRIFK